jgi:hypothetical protein
MESWPTQGANTPAAETGYLSFPILETFTSSQDGVTQRGVSTHVPKIAPKWKKRTKQQFFKTLITRPGNKDSDP